MPSYDLSGLYHGESYTFPRPERDLHEPEDQPEKPTPMSATPHDGGNAFPQPLDSCGMPVVGFKNGMSLRDWLAGQAINGLCASPDVNVMTSDALAKGAYALADAMLAARAKQTS